MTNADTGLGELKCHFIWAVTRLIRGWAMSVIYIRERNLDTYLSVEEGAIGRLPDFSILLVIGPSKA